MRERIIVERTITTENGRTVRNERKICGVLDADGTFRLKAYCGKCFSVQQESGGRAKNGKVAA